MSQLLRTPWILEGIQTTITTIKSCRDNGEMKDILNSEQEFSPVTEKAKGRHLQVTDILQKGDTVLAIVSDKYHKITAEFSKQSVDHVKLKFHGGIQRGAILQIQQCRLHLPQTNGHFFEAGKTLEDQLWDVISHAGPAVKRGNVKSYFNRIPHTKPQLFVEEVKFKAFEPSIIGHPKLVWEELGKKRKFFEQLALTTATIRQEAPLKEAFAHFAKASCSPSATATPAAFSAPNGYSDDSDDESLKSQQVSGADESFEDTKISQLATQAHPRFTSKRRKKSDAQEEKKAKSTESQGEEEDAIIIVSLPPEPKPNASPPLLKNKRPRRTWSDLDFPDEAPLTAPVVAKRNSKLATPKEVFELPYQSSSTDSEDNSDAGSVNSWYTKEDISAREAHIPRDQQKILESAASWYPPQRTVVSGYDAIPKVQPAPKVHPPRPKSPTPPSHPPRRKASRHSTSSNLSSNSPPPKSRQTSITSVDSNGAPKRKKRSLGAKIGDDKGKEAIKRRQRLEQGVDDHARKKEQALKRAVSRSASPTTTCTTSSKSKSPIPASQSFGPSQIEVVVQRMMRKEFSQYSPYPALPDESSEEENSQRIPWSPTPPREVKGKGTAKKKARWIRDSTELESSEKERSPVIDPECPIKAVNPHGATRAQAYGILGAQQVYLWQMHKDDPKKEVDMETTEDDGTDDEGKERDVYNQLASQMTSHITVDKVAMEIDDAEELLDQDQKEFQQKIVEILSRETTPRPVEPREDQPDTTTENPTSPTGTAKPVPADASNNAVPKELAKSQPIFKKPSGPLSPVEAVSDDEDDFRPIQLVPLGRRHLPPSPPKPKSAPSFIEPLESQNKLSPQVFRKGVEDAHDPIESTQSSQAKPQSLPPSIAPNLKPVVQVKRTPYAGPRGLLTTVSAQNTISSMEEDFIAATLPEEHHSPHERCSVAPHPQPISVPPSSSEPSPPHNLLPQHTQPCLPQPPPPLSLLSSPKRSYSPLPYPARKLKKVKRTANISTQEVRNAPNDLRGIMSQQRRDFFITNPSMPDTQSNTQPTTTTTTTTNSSPVRTEAAVEIYTSPSATPHNSAPLQLSFDSSPPKQTTPQPKASQVSFPPMMATQYQSTHHHQMQTQTPAQAVGRKRPAAQSLTPIGVPPIKMKRNRTELITPTSVTAKALCDILGPSPTSPSFPQKKAVPESPPFLNKQQQPILGRRGPVSEETWKKREEMRRRFLGIYSGVEESVAVSMLGPLRVETERVEEGEEKEEKGEKEGEAGMVRKRWERAMEEGSENAKWWLGEGGETGLGRWVRAWKELRGNQVLGMREKREGKRPAR